MVVGATYPEAVARVRERAPHAPLLLPGVGAQGGGPSRGGASFAASRALYYPGGRPDLKAALEAAEALLKALVE